MPTSILFQIGFDKRKKNMLRRNKKEINDEKKKERRYFNTPSKKNYTNKFVHSSTSW